MIAYFPEIYSDELLYSLLARYYAASGYTAYRYAAEDLFVIPAVRPDVKFVNRLTAPAIEILTKTMSMESIILGHTMFPYYGRFLKTDRRKKAFDSLVLMQGNYYNLLPIPKKKTDSERYLRYCPVCAENDRKQYGEAYWHRNHQMTGVDICPKHFCRLINSTVTIGGKAVHR